MKLCGLKMQVLSDHWPRWTWEWYFVSGLQPWAQNIWTGAPRVAAWSHPTVPGSAFASPQPPPPFSESSHKNRLEEYGVKAGFPIRLLICVGLPQYEHCMLHINFLVLGLHAPFHSLRVFPAQRNFGRPPQRGFSHPPKENHQCQNGEWLLIDWR